MRLWVDKIASSTRNVPLRREIHVQSEITAEEGYIVAARIRGEKTVYNQLEDVHGRLIQLHDGDVIAGVLGHRNALQGYSGVVPDSLAVGQRLQVLNLGGVIGQCTSVNIDVGPPLDAEILGAVLTFPDFEDRSGVPAHIRMNAIPCRRGDLPDVPVIFIAGTCMNSGKTSAACRLVRQLAVRGMVVGGCKLTGVSLRRDTLQMSDYGAKWAVSFTDAGIVSTGPDTAVTVAHGLIRHLAAAGAEAIVAELGDGILGEYGVAPILADRELMRLAAAIIVCANDPVAAWGAKQVMAERFGLSIDVVSGPTTDNLAGTRFIGNELGLTAINARTHGAALGDFIFNRLAAGGEAR
ncbi:MAG: hypothetical protein GX594_04170, partial [Pirellulaceae bacterium]|nr:hypothetical protein [Pirellulaceae bacterium]